ncbi:unnamed protein product [Nyctereutes procyonoides]|uniref:Small ribosomal subunit protein bS16m n=1 Tax=Nyctereutes procyonoides TaxID=34880 RepID=A0A811ZW25_NYCPR|nr:unnamed protein product [Nyctereutes procyonoides]
MTQLLSTAKAYHRGHLTIRLALSDCANQPFYHIHLDSYDPLPNSHGKKIVALNLDQIWHWIHYGTHLSQQVEKILGLSGFVPVHPMMITYAERPQRKGGLLLASQ